MNLQQLDHFLALVETGSFSRAAERVHVSQPALSRSIQALEEELGTPLFDRLGRRSEPTAAGHLVLRHARRIHLELSELRRCATLVDTLEAGQLTLGLGATPHEMLAAPLLRHFHANHPRTSVKITASTPGTMLQALRERRLDAVILHQRLLPAWDDLAVEPLPALRLGFLCRDGHPLRAEGPLRLEQLQQHVVAASGTGLGAEMVQRLNEHFGEGANVGRLIHYTADGISCLLDLVQDSDILFFGVVAAARPRLLAGRLAELQTTPPLSLGSPFAMVTLRGLTPLPAWRAARSLAREIMRDG